MAALLGAAAFCTGSISARSTPDTRPNVIVLMTDDQTVESLRVMPQVRRSLMREGATFENSFVSYPLCCPSRATLLTGQYAHNHGVLSNAPPAGGYQALDGAQTLPVWLRRAGYTTALVGKYLNGYGRERPREVPPGWSEWYASVDPTTYRYFGYTLNENGRLVRYGRRPEQYDTDVFADLAVDVVRRRAREAAPFFLWVSFLAPHEGGPTGPERVRGSALPAPRHRGRFAEEPLPRPASFDEADVSDKPPGVRGRPRLDRTHVAAITERYRLRLESLLAVDDAVGRIVSELERAGELENTLIVFTSDNGYLQGEHRIPLGKVSLYEPATRVPLVMRGPGIRAGLRLSQAVSNVDLAPTIVDVARARAGLTMDGESLWPLLRDPGIYRGRDLLHEGSGGSSSVLSFTALRTPRWVYAQHFSGAEELYDLEHDPDQLVNLASSAEAAAVRSELRGRLAALARCAGQGCRVGPRIEVQVGLDGACPAARAQVAIEGPDAAAVVRARFRVGQRTVATDTSAPYAFSYGLGASAPRLRVDVTLADGRRQTIDARLPACR